MEAFWWALVLIIGVREAELQAAFKFIRPNQLGDGIDYTGPTCNKL